MIQLTETRERFFRAITKEIPVDEIAEIHFFQPMRQGGVESGVAVVASRGDGRRAAAGDGEAPKDDEAVSEERERYTVYTARYLQTLKGPDRGKWEASVVPEADAPLITVDAVVRGVQRRSGDVEEVDRMTGDEARELFEQLARAPSPAPPSVRA